MEAAHNGGTQANDEGVTIELKPPLAIKFGWIKGVLVRTECVIKRPYKLIAVTCYCTLLGKPFIQCDPYIKGHSTFKCYVMLWGGG